MRLFRKRADAAAPPSSGHALDDALLVRIAGASDLARPRHWVHYLYFPTESEARAAGQVVDAAGWDVRPVDRAPGGRPEWSVVAERRDVVTSPDAVREARAFFEGVAATHGPGQYDGWEASVEP